MRCSALILALLLVAGCKMETPQANRGCQPVEAIVTTWSDPGSEASVRVGDSRAFIVRGRNAESAVKVSVYDDGVVRVEIGEPVAKAALWDTVYAGERPAIRDTIINNRRWYISGKTAYRISDQFVTERADTIRIKEGS